MSPKEYAKEVVETFAFKGKFDFGLDGSVVKLKEFAKVLPNKLKKGPLYATTGLQVQTIPTNHNPSMHEMVLYASHQL